MKVTYILTTADMGGGTERAVFTQANWLASRASVEIVSVYRTAPKPHFTPDRRVRVRYVGSRPENPTASTLVPEVWDNQFDGALDAPLERALRGLRTDIAITTTPALAYLVARLAPRSVRVIHQEHRFSGARGAGLEPLRIVAQRLSDVVVLSRRNADFLRLDPAFADTPISIIGNPIDVGAYPVSRLTQPLIVSAGRLVAPKRFDALVRAFAIATEAAPQWRLRILGRGPARPAIQSSVRREHLETRVELPGESGDIAAHLAKASIFALSSRSEAFSLVLLEAQAAGVPVVTYDTPVGPREILTHTGGGIVVPDGSIGGLAAGIERLIDDADLRRDFGAAARRGAWHFDTDQVMAQWMALLTGERVVDAHPSVSGAGELRDSGESVAPPSQGDVYTHVVEALASASIPFRPASPLPSGAWRLAGNREDAPRILRALESADLTGFSVTAHLGADPLTDAWLIGSPRPTLADSADTLELSDASGVTRGAIQLWTLRDERRTILRADDGPDSVDLETWRTWMHAGTPTPSGQPYWNARGFDIDVVYTWVDGSDPAWRARKALFETGTHTSEAVRDARFRNRNELVYSIRSVRNFMPWVRRVFVVTDDQVPRQVLEEFPDVQIVDHREIFPDQTNLPTFNSHAIEASIHRIPGLAEHYIYFNDDVLVARPLSDEHFFHPNGIAKFFPSGAAINYGDVEDKPHLQAGANNRRLLQRRFGIEITRNLLHTPHPQRRTVVEELESENPQAFAVTRAARFRSETDYSIASSLAPYYGFATGRFVPGTIGYRYMPLRADALSSRLQSVLDDPRVDVVALGEPMEDDRRHRDEDELLRDFLEQLTSRRSIPVYAPLEPGAVHTVQVSAASYPPETEPAHPSDPRSATSEPSDAETPGAP